MKNQNNYYITTPIYYVNSKPHIGTLYSTLLADVSARWNKLLGKNVFFLTGTDEHGQKIQEKAEQTKMAPQAFVDSMIPAFKKVWEQYNIKYDKFIRTTDAEHKKAVEFFINKLKAQDDIYKSSYIGLYCVPDETFVSPEAAAANNNMCPTCKRELREVSEESYFFRLSAYQDRLLAFYENNPDFVVPKERLNEVISFVKSGLKDLSISRKTVKWGIPFPGDPEHTVYVWGDALTNYISAIGYGQDAALAQTQFEAWWPANVHVMAKDIVRFHAVYWPAFLMSAGLPLPSRLLVHGYILTGDQKMSKSLGNAIDPETLGQQYGIDQVRYYLMRQMPITQDSQFDFKALEEHINADLANTLGNLLRRITGLAEQNNLMTIKPQETWEPFSGALKHKCEEAFRSYWEEMNKGYYHIAIAELWKFISMVNAYVQEQQPWVLAKKNKALFEEVLSAVCQSLHTIGILLWPVMPVKSEELLQALGVNLVIGTNYEDALRKNNWDKTFTLVQQEKPLFARIELTATEAPENKATDVKALKPEKQTQESAKESVKEGAIVSTEAITIQDFLKLDLRVGTIMSCEPLPKSDKLLKMQVDFDKLGTRQIMAGVAQSFKPEALLGKQGLFVFNLPPRKMLGEESQGMMMFAKDEHGNMQMTTVGENIENGSKLC